MHRVCASEGVSTGQVTGVGCDGFGLEPVPEHDQVLGFRNDSSLSRRDSLALWVGLRTQGATMRIRDVDRRVATPWVTNLLTSLALTTDSRRSDGLWLFSSQSFASVAKPGGAALSSRCLPLRRCWWRLPEQTWLAP